MSFKVSRQKHSLINIGLALISQVTVVIVGLFLPRAIIQAYGSETNGLVTSLQQIITYFTLVEGGLAGATIFALYKPLTQDDKVEVCRILSATKKFYFKVGITYLALLLIAMLIYPFMIARTAFSIAEIMALVLFIGVNGATQLWVIGKYKALLMASQYSGVVFVLNSASTGLYSVLLILLAYYHVYVVLAFAVASIAYIIRALAFFIAVRKIHPQVNYNADSKEYKLQQRNDVLLQQLLSMLVMNSSVFILTFSKSPMALISVFTVYNLVLSSLYTIMNSINNGIAAGFGDLIACGDTEKLRKTYKEFEVMFQMLWTWVFSCLSVLYLPFIRVYTLNITDAHYILPTVCVLFILIGASWTIRNQQSILIVAAGRFREIRNGSIIEASLTVILSMVGFMTYGLVGMLIGRLLVTMYRAVDYIIHCNKYVVKISMGFTFWQICLSIVSVGASYTVSSLVFTSYPDSFVSWTVEAICCAVVCAAVMLVFRLIFDSSTTLSVLERFAQMLKNTFVGKDNLKHNSLKERKV
ncbi:membrane protein [Desulfosporosinus sp. OT]|uniref:membrane protein n=1 Tax=Desulfosporosinus sp. OT TaxID=913865 RepID=UPI000223A930|nr:membrane protein [Desulfosporosinus sp. OT]EGW38466.1 putative membrane protein [Desulfosporosinus sp. OT]